MQAGTTSVPAVPALDVSGVVLAGGGEMAARSRALDWGATPLGAVEQWPHSLRTAARIVLGSSFPSILVWGPELVQIYNDAYIPLIGSKHPSALGMRTHDCWPGIRDVQEPIFARVFAGETVHIADAPYLLDRGDAGTTEEAYFTASFIPVPDDTGAIGGSLSTLFESTREVRARSDIDRARRETSRILAATGDGILGVDASGRTTFVNPAAERILGWAAAELAGRSQHEMIHHTRPDGTTYPEVECPLYDARRTGDGYRSDQEVFWRKDGTSVPVEYAMTPIIEEDEVTGAVVSFRDITARRLAAAEREGLLAENAAARERLGRVLAQAPAAVGVVLGPDHVVHSTNEIFLRLFGRREYVGHRMIDGLPELVEQGFLARMDEVYRTGVAFEGREASFTWDRDGNGRREEGFFDFVYQPIVDGSGAVEGILIFAVDVTAQVRARHEVERLLEDSERARHEADMLGAHAREMELLSRQLFTLSPLPAWVYDRETLAFLEVNAAAERHYGFSREEFMTMTLLDIRPADEIPRLRAVLAQPHPAAGPRGGSRHRTRSGEVIEVEVFSQDVERAGRPAGIVVVQDVTERRRAEAALLEAKQAADEARAEAEAANRAKSEFLAVMSHELRTPLNAIGGYAELLEMGVRGPVTDQQRADLSRIQASQRHLLGLINEVLNYARLETGNVRYDISDVSLREATAAAEALVSPQAHTKGLALRITPCEAELHARADVEKLRQILVNLLSNAVKFTDRGGRVDVSCGVAGDRVLVRVRDTGIGIPEDKLAAIFEPFVQVRADLTRTAEGAGLGLAISRDLARGMSGDLTAESTPGVGSTFTVSLPRA